MRGTPNLMWPCASRTLALCSSWDQTKLIGSWFGKNYPGENGRVQTLSRLVHLDVETWTNCYMIASVSSEKQKEKSYLKREEGVSRVSRVWDKYRKSENILKVIDPGQTRENVNNTWRCWGPVEVGEHYGSYDVGCINYFKHCHPAWGPSDSSLHPGTYDLGISPMGCNTRKTK